MGIRKRKDSKMISSVLKCLPGGMELSLTGIRKTRDRFAGVR